ncbi:TRAF-type zinc finger domain-containing protein 1-like [Nematostella vectensis]|uniref:TRAF-type zinc finger domain-containing protein 1-like n=1 Tax=Nematostella vectensis TaxID=45351 RepID=UPI00139003A0|nr:TRAF-type zinc finger domain-containing protein 1-like [Nematostella vectensis]
METCDRCKKQVPGVNFVMHIAHCTRNTEICPICGEFYPKSSSKEHIDEYHKEISCELCGDVVESKAKLTEHESHCSKRKICCAFCELSMNRNELEEHEDFCGSRTEKCASCNKFVLLRDQQNHCCIENSTPNQSQDDVLLPCEFCEKLVRSADLLYHQESCANPEVQLPPEIIDLTEDADNTGELSNNIVDLTEEEEEEEVLTDNNVDVTDSAEGGKVRSRSPSPVCALPCEVCGELCPADRLIEHQDACLRQSNSDDSQQSDSDDVTMAAPNVWDSTPFYGRAFPRHATLAEFFDDDWFVHRRWNPGFGIDIMNRSADPFDIMWRNMQRSMFYNM